eukprot:TRINITY_DN40887_c0_g1_i1.p1 TRINITY_DN40887_c0_g1~~TRINITY_DN40887_c0_g1_i1.p1  ORF type:complete len:638 (+),score=180.71 TRINITY_DN40887_c0_g1_i1:108-2021(+)
MSSSSSDKIRKKHPGLVPVICLGPGTKHGSKDLVTTKLLCPRDMTGIQFRKVVIEKAPMPVGLTTDKFTLYLKTTGPEQLLCDEMTMDRIDREFVSADGYVYVIIEINAVKSPVREEEPVGEAPPVQATSSEEVCNTLATQVFHLADQDSDDEDADNSGASPMGFASSTRVAGRSHESRVARSRKILTKYPDRIPVHVKQPPRNNWPAVDKKFLTPMKMDCREFKEVLRKQLPEAVKDALWANVSLFAGNAMLKQCATMQEIYENNKAPDLLLYITFDTLSNKLECPFPGSPYEDVQPVADKLKLEDLKLRVRELEKKCQIAEDKVGVRDDKIAALELSLSECDEKLKVEQDAHAEARDAHAEARARIEALSQEAQLASDAGRIAEINMSDYQMKLQDKTTTCRQLEIQVSDAQSKEWSLRASLEVATGKNEDLTKLLKASKEAEEKSQQELASQKQLTKELQDKIQRLTDELEATQTDQAKGAEQLVRENAASRASEAKTHAELSRVQALTKEAQEKNRTLSNDLEAETKKCAQLWEKVQAMQAKQAMTFQEKVQKADADAARIRELERLLTATEEEKVAFRSRVEKMEAERAKQQAEKKKSDEAEEDEFVKVEVEDEAMGFYSIGQPDTASWSAA